MIYTNDYESPMGNILLAGDEHGLTGVIPIGKNLFTGGNSIIIGDKEYFVNEQITVVLNSRNDRDLIFEFASIGKKMVKKKRIG